MSDMYDQSYNNPYHFNRHSLGDQNRINRQNAPQNTSWFTGGSPSHNQRNGSILRDNGRFVLPSAYNQPRSQSYNKYNTTTTETEYNSEYVPYSPEYYQPIKGLGKRLDIDKKQPFRDEQKNNGSFVEYGKYDIPPALLKKLKMLEKQYGNYEIENQEETEDEKSFEEEPDIIIPKKKPNVIKPKPRARTQPKKITPEEIHYEEIKQDEDEIKVNLIPTVKNANKRMKIVKPELIENVIGKDKSIIINKDSSDEKPIQVEMNESDEKPKASEKPKEMQIPYTISKPIDKGKEEEDEDKFELINEVKTDGEKQNQYESAKPIKPKIEEEKPKPKIEEEKPKPKIEEEKPKPKIQEEKPKPKIEPKPQKKFDPISAQYYDDSNSYLNRGIVISDDNVVERANYDDIYLDEEELSERPVDEIEPKDENPKEEEVPGEEVAPKEVPEEENITGIIPGIKDNNVNQEIEGSEIPLQEDQSVDLNRKHKVKTQVYDPNKKKGNVEKKKIMMRLNHIKVV